MSEISTSGEAEAEVDAEKHNQQADSSIVYNSHKPNLAKVNSEYDAFEHEDESQFPDGGIQAWLCVIGSAFGLMTVFGVMNTISSIQLYIQSNQLSDVKISNIAWVFGLYMFFNLGVSIISGPIFDTFGIKKILLPGMILNCAGLYATAYSTKLWHFILSFGFAAGIGGGLCMNPLVSVTNHWFLKNRGLANGVSQCGSISGVFFPLMLRSLYPKLGYSKTMVIMASLCVFMSIVSYLLVKDRTDIIGEPGFKELPFKTKIKQGLDLEGFKERPFLILTAAVFINEFSILLVIAYISTYGEVRGMSQSTAFLLLVVKNSSGILGTVIPNSLGDFIGRFNMMVLTSLLMTITIFAIWLPYYNNIGLFIFAGLYGFGFCGVYSLTPTCIAQISATNKFGARFATVYFIVAFSNLISMPIGSQFINDQTVRNYNHMIIFAGSTCAAATALFYAARFSLVGFQIKKFV
ncbi:hypothetical protein CANARDRAFT_213399 [[Candida] arabinofermentans NRRL YB-2248]|uniref:Major facilitator superfamily (MFS) profile domain-containing protein n=1 Tax=[Candida] arabinofermentans NRRL YB-2248 TaxID=983967 RepID=A0A1E4SYD1_9ASCO|nr:hypothetical protein CANARDRAFT_213399 [[Candida] arabinofermentans NRRL YB-2248]